MNTGNFPIANLETGEHYKVKILKLVSKGKGMALLENRVLFVPYVLPDEEVEIEITQIKKDYLLAKKVSVVTPAPLRTVPVCPVFEQCGGCQLQMIDYAGQLDIKSGFLKESLLRIGKINPLILPIIPASDPLYYRQRVQFKISFLHEHPIIGFYRPESRMVVPVERCHIIKPLLNSLLGEVRQLIERTPDLYHPLKEITFSASSLNDDIFIELNVGAGSMPDHALQDFFKLPFHIRGLGITQNEKQVKVFGKNSIVHSIKNPLDPAESLKSRNSGGVFSQVNREMNLKLIETLMSWAGLTGKEEVLELFSGNGNFTLLLAKYASHLTAVEENPLAIEDLRYNLQVNGIKNCSVRKGKTQEVLSRWDKSTFPLDLLILDPPREGIDPPSVKSILRIAPRRIYYISCDPATLARDLKALSKRYNIQRIAPFDMFPQTAHLETLTELQRKS
ncbi:MAG: class I SAM-dependent RNA methyltransferase [Nitrospirae bacterium]|nr:class I SAM-dependent RNA methyltransferase [Nitrospirota bacterium]